MNNYVNKKILSNWLITISWALYKNTKVSELAETFESIKIQIHKPKKVILVLDGFIEKKVLNLVDKYTNILPIKKSR